MSEIFPGRQPTFFSSLFDSVALTCPASVDQDIAIATPDKVTINRDIEKEWRGDGSDLSGHLFLQSPPGHFDGVG